MRFELIFLSVFSALLGFMFFCMAKIENERALKIALYCGFGVVESLAILTVIKMMA